LIVASILATIVARRRERVAEAGRQPALPAPQYALWTAHENAFLGALTRARRERGGGVIAEVKMGSPRLAKLADRVDPLAQARLYAAHGAAALSVVVEPDFFFGSHELLTACARESGLPAVAKDFVIDPLQIVWAAEAGAAAVLLIAALLETEELVRFAALARGLGMVPLVEVHDAEDVAKLAHATWELVGINNRDLTTFQVDLGRSGELRQSLPAGTLTVAESGIRSRGDAARLISSGFDALLVGESLLLAPNPAELLSELTAGISSAARHAG
jgi:indole-3-glycerol phosphate synthase